MRAVVHALEAMIIDICCIIVFIHASMIKISSELHLQLTFCGKILRIGN